MTIEGSSRSFTSASRSPNANPVRMAPVTLRLRHASTRGERAVWGRASSTLALDVGARRFLDGLAGASAASESSASGDSSSAGWFTSGVTSSDTVIQGSARGRLSTAGRPLLRRGQGAGTGAGSMVDPIR